MEKIKEFLGDTTEKLSDRYETGEFATSRGSEIKRCWVIGMQVTAHGCY